MKDMHILTPPHYTSDACPEIEIIILSFRNVYNRKLWWGRYTVKDVPNLYCLPVPVTPEITY